MKSLKFFVFSIFFIHYSIARSQIVGGREPGEMTPHEVKSNNSIGAEVNDQVNLSNGSYQATYPLGSVSTDGGIRFDLNLRNSGAGVVGGIDKIIKGIPYGEGWELDLPTISVNSASFRSISPQERRNAINNNLTSIPPIGLNDGDIYWHSVNVSIPGRLNCRAVYKYTDSLDRKVFVPNVFESYAEIILEGEDWIVRFDDGTTYTFYQTVQGVRAASNDRAVFDYYYSNINLQGVDNSTLKNQIIPKREILKWYCTRISNRNIPEQYIMFSYEMFGQFNFFQEYEQTALFNSIKQKLGPYPRFHTFQDILPKTIMAYNQFSEEERFDIEFETKQIGGYNTLRFWDDDDVKRKDSLYSYKTVYKAGDNDATSSTGDIRNSFSGWKRYLHAAHDDIGTPSTTEMVTNVTTINPNNPYCFTDAISNTNWFYFKDNLSGSSVDFDHGYLESERLDGDDIIVAGDIYELKTTIASKDVFNPDFMNIDINIATGRYNGTLNVNEYAIQGVGRINEDNYNKNISHSAPAGKSIFSTFSSAIKWNTVASSKTHVTGRVETSNYFVMENLPNEYQGFFIQVGPGNSDHEYNLAENRLSRGVISPLSDFQDKATTAYYAKFRNTSAGSGDKKYFESIPSSFGIGMPWFMVNELYTYMGGLHFNYDDFWFNTTNKLTHTWSNEPTLGVTSLHDVELVRFSKNTYMLSSVKKFIATEEFRYDNHDDFTLVSNIKFHYKVESKQSIKKADKRTNSSTFDLNSSNTITHILLESIEDSATNPTEMLNSQGSSESRITKFDYVFKAKTNLALSDDYYTPMEYPFLSEIINPRGKETRIEYYSLDSDTNMIKALYKKSQYQIENSYSDHTSNWNDAYLLTPSVKKIKTLIGDNDYSSKVYEYSAYNSIPYYNRSILSLNSNNFFYSSSDASYDIAGYKEVKEFDNEVDGLRNYKLYTYNDLSELLGLDQFLSGKLKKVELFNYDNSLNSRQTYFYDVIMAFKNGSERPARDHDGFRFDYLDFFIENQLSIPNGVNIEEDFLPNHNQSSIKINHSNFESSKFYEHENIGIISSVDKNSFFVYKTKEVNENFSQNNCFITNEAISNFENVDPPSYNFVSYPQTINSALMGEGSFDFQNNLIQAESLGEIKDQITEYSPLDDYTIRLFLSNTKISEQFNSENLKIFFDLQNSLSDSILIYIITDSLMQELKVFEIYSEAYGPNFSNNVLLEIINNSSIISNSLIQNILINHGDLNDSLLLSVLLNRDYLGQSLVEALLVNQSHLSDTVLLSVIDENSNLDGTAIKNIFSSQNTQFSESILFELYNEGSMRFPDETVEILIGLNSSLPASITSNLNSSSGNITEEDITKIENHNQNLILNSINCNSNINNGDFSVKTITEYKYYTANQFGVSKSDGYKDLMDLNKDSIYLKFEPSWQLYSKKQYSPNFPNAFTEKRYYYLFDMYNKYERYVDEYNTDINGNSSLVQVGYGTINSDSKGESELKINGFGFDYPYTTAMSGVKKNGIRSIAYQTKNISRNGTNKDPIETSDYYIYDRNWAKDPTSFYGWKQVDTSLLQPCLIAPSQVISCELKPYSKRRMIITWTRTNFKNDFGKWIHFPDTVFTGLPLNSFIIEVKEPGFPDQYFYADRSCFRSFGSDTTVIRNPIKSYNSNQDSDYSAERDAPRWDYSDAVQLREVYTNVDTVLTESFLNRPPNYQVFGLANHLDFRFETPDPEQLQYLTFPIEIEVPIFPLDVLKLYKIHDRNIYNKPSLIEDEKGIFTRYVYDKMNYITYFDSTCMRELPRYANVGYKSMPRKVVIGSGRDDSTTTFYDYYPNLAVKSIKDFDNNSEVSYKYDDFGRLIEERINGVLFNEYEYNNWNNNENLSFRQRTSQNYIQNINYNTDSISSAVLSKTFYDPLGRIYQSLTVELPNGKNTTQLPTEIEYSGLKEYDDRGRVLREYRPFQFDSLGVGLMLIPRDVSNDLNTYPHVAKEFSYEADWNGRVLTESKFGQAGVSGKKLTYSYELLNSNCIVCDLNIGSSQVELLMPKGIDEDMYRFYKVEVTDEDGKVSSNYTNSFGQSVASKNINGNDDIVTSFGYDNLGKLSKVINPKGQSSTYNYNLLGWLYKTKTVDGGETKFMYDKSGQIVLQQDRNAFEEGKMNLFSNNVEPYFIKLEYDDYGRLIKKGVVFNKPPNGTHASIDVLSYETKLIGDKSYADENYPYYYYEFTNQSTLSWLAKAEVSADISGGGPGQNFVFNNIPLFNSLSNMINLQDWVYGPDDNHTIPTISNINQLKGSRENLKGRLNYTIRYADDYVNYSLADKNMIEVAYFDYSNKGDLKGLYKQFNPNGITSGNKGLATAQFFSDFTNNGAWQTHNIDVNADADLDLQYFRTYNAKGQLSDVYVNYNDDKGLGNLIASYSYDNVFGRVINKDLYYNNLNTPHVVDQVAYSYDIRDRLTSTNSNWLDYNLYYDNNNASVGAIQPNGDLNFNGNINGIKSTYKLQSSSNYTNGYLFDQPSIYNYEYDSLNRLTIANSYLPDFGTTNNLGNTVYSYDKIGNIIDLERIVDNQNTTQAFDYYYEGSTNRLSFVKGKQGTPDRNYTYDSNGNLKSDNSRQIVDIDYNSDNMPISIKKSENIEGSNSDDRVDYKYGINNERLYKQVYNNYNLPIVQGSVAEYYLSDPSGKTIGMLDIASGEWEWYVHGSDRVARFKPISSRQPTFHPGDWWSGKDNYNGVSAVDVNEIRLAIENYMLAPGEPDNLLFINSESLNLQLELESELPEEGEFMFNPEMSMSLVSPNQLLIFKGSNGESYTTTLAAFYEGNTASSLPDASAIWTNRASLTGGINANWPSSGTLIESPERVDYYRYDHLGNTRVVYEAEWDADLSQVKFNLKGAYDYFPYGKILRSYVPGNGYERYLTTGHERDAETISNNTDGTGFDYRFARMSDSDVPKFNSIDPAAAEYPSWSPYSLVLANPIMVTDPDGKRADNYTVHADGQIDYEKTDDSFDQFFLANGNGDQTLVGKFDKNENGLIQLPSQFSFSNADFGTNFGFSVKPGQESQSFISGKAFAGLIGALSTTNITDLTITKFSNSDGSSPGKSVSHVNGVNGDLRYLRSDRSGGSQILGNSGLDLQRQSAFTNALYNFGWKDMISERFNNTLLPRTSSASERGIGSDHTNHLHLQGFSPNIIVK